MLMMIGLGWQIYDASPLFGFTFPSQIALDNWLAGARAADTCHLRVH
jgi:thiosulfate reductase cytochrome b subunit